MFTLTSALDTLKGYGTVLGDATKDVVKGAADATVAAAADVIRNAGKPSSAVQETHKRVAVGENKDGSPVVPLPAGTSTVAGQIVTTSTVPEWVWWVGGLSLVVIVGGVTYKIVQG